MLHPRIFLHDLSERLPVAGRDEFSGLSSSFHAMLARLEEAFDRQRRFTSDASHEVRTPSTRLFTNRLENAVRHTPPEGTPGWAESTPARIGLMTLEARGSSIRSRVQVPMKD